MDTLPCPTFSRNGHAAPTVIPQGPSALAEAPCSMTAHVCVPALSRDALLITGRGHSGAEAARNLREAISAIQTPEVPPLASRTQRLSLLLACGLEKAHANGDRARVERLLKAASLVLAGCVSQDQDGAYTVRSATEPEKTVYRVTGRACTCPDAARHLTENGVWCKHSLAALLEVKLHLQEQEYAAACEGR